MGKTTTITAPKKLQGKSKQDGEAHQDQENIHPNPKSVSIVTNEKSKNIQTVKQKKLPNTKVKVSKNKNDKKGQQKNDDGKCESAAVSKLSAMGKLFNEAQHSFTTHNQSISILRKLHQSAQTEKNGKINFTKEFISHVDRVLLVFKREPAVERLIEFIASYSTQASDHNELRDEFAIFLMRYLKIIIL